MNAFYYYNTKILLLKIFNCFLVVIEPPGGRIFKPEYMLKNAESVPHSVQLEHLEKNVTKIALSKFQSHYVPLKPQFDCAPTNPQFNHGPSNSQLHYAPPKPQFAREPKRKITAIVAPKNVG